MGLFSKVPLWTWVVIFVCAVVTGILVLILISPRGNMGTGNSSSSSSRSTSLTTSIATASSISPEDINKTKDYPYAGIKPNDTVAMFDDRGETTINLDHLQWQNLQWSTDGGLVSVLGANAQGVYDLYIYQIETGDWRKATTYQVGSIGISAYDWLSETKVAFTQGVNPDNWIHNYDFANNELVKKFRVDGILKFVQPENERYIVENSIGSNSFPNSNYQVFDKDGVEMFEFSGSLLAANHRILSVRQGRTEDEFIIESADNSSSKATWVWNFNDPVFRRITYSLATSTSGAAGLIFSPMCSRDEESFQVVGTNMNGIVVGAIRPPAGQVRDLANVSRTNIDFVYTCEEGKVVLGLKQDSNYAWLLLDSGIITDLELGEGYSEVITKPQQN